MKFLIMSLFALSFVSCSHLSSVSQTSIPKDKSKIVEAKVENNIFFFLNFNNDYVDTLTQQLMDQCPKGSIKGILTKDENITYFPIVYHKSIVTAKGYCVTHKRLRKNNKKNKRM